MYSLERLEDLRKQNRELLAKLKHQTGKLQKLHSADLASGREMENETPESSGRVSGKESAFNETEGRYLAEDVSERSSPAEDTIQQQQPLVADSYSQLLQDRGNIRFPRAFNMAEQMQPKPGLVSQGDDVVSRSSRDVGRIPFPTPDHELEFQSERQRVQPLLGYDWIAGLLDAESSLSDRSEQFFSELHNFRQVNEDECVHGQLRGLPVVEAVFSSPVEDEERVHSPDTHQCMFCYRINSRLFATPLDPQVSCPVCKKPKDEHPHTEKEPAFIRVSIPRSTLLPAYRYKAHHRSSFDPSDSLGLPSHCSSGWSHVIPKSDIQMSSLDLRSCVRAGMVTAAMPSDPPDNPLDLPAVKTVGHLRSDQLLDLSRLARFRFQHLGPKMSKIKGSTC